jgi:hypothetical protein
VTRYELVRACSLLLLGGHVLHCPKPWVTAQGADVAWRETKKGSSRLGPLRLTRGDCAFDAALEYVRRAGERGRGGLSG